MFTMSVILQQCLLHLVAVAALGFVQTCQKLFEYCWLQSSLENPDEDFSI